jgi:hypothetical protein
VERRQRYTKGMETLVEDRERHGVWNHDTHEAGNIRHMNSYGQ